MIVYLLVGIQEMITVLLKMDILIQKELFSDEANWYKEYLEKG